jgi:gas vesicle protein
MFELNGSTLVGIGTVLGALCGAITFLMNALLKSKEETTETLREQNKEIAEDRDYWRNYALSLIGPTDKALSIAEDAAKETKRLRRVS